MYLIFEKLEFAEMILLRLIVYYLVRLKHYHLRLLKNNSILE